MKNTIRKSVLMLAATLFCASSAFAAESALQTQAVQDQLKSTNATEKQEHYNRAKEGYKNLTPDEQDRLKSDELQHRQNIHNYRVKQIQEKNQVQQ